MLLAGGTLNEAASASVALVDVDGAPARWTDKAGPPLCFECPTVDPAGMFLLPTSEVSKAMLRPYGWVMQGKPVAGGVELSAHDGFGRGSIVTLSDNLRVTDFLRSDQYWQAHKELEKQGRLDHTVDICPDLVSAPRGAAVDAGGWLVHDRRSPPGVVLSPSRFRLTSSSTGCVNQRHSGRVAP